MFETKKELAIEIAEVDRVQIDNVDFTKAGQKEILQQLAADAPSPDEEHSRLSQKRPLAMRWNCGMGWYLANATGEGAK